MKFNLVIVSTLAGTAISAALPPTSDPRNHHVSSRSAHPTASHISKVHATVKPSSSPSHEPRALPPVPKPAAIEDTLLGFADKGCQVLGCQTLLTTTRTTKPAATPPPTLNARGVVPAPKPVVPAVPPKEPAAVEYVNQVKDFLEKVCEVGQCKTITKTTTQKVAKATETTVPVRLGATAAAAVEARATSSALKRDQPQLLDREAMVKRNKILCFTVGWGCI